MSLSYAIGSRTHAQPQRKGKNPVTKTTTATTDGTKTKLTTTVNTPPKPRVVTLDSLKQTSTSRGKKAATTTTKSNVRTPKKTATQPAVRTNTSKMWDDDHDDFNATGRNSMSVQGQGDRRFPDRNTSSSGNAYSPAARMSRMTDDGVLTRPPGQPNPDEERRDTYNPSGGYTLVTPNPQKREKLQNGASQELERLAAYQEKKKVSHVSITPGRVGGSKMSEEEVRRRQLREQEKKKFDNIKKRQQWAAEKKAREDKEFNDKKARAREQAERNKRREAERQRDMTYDRQRWMERGGLEKLESEEAKRSVSKDEEFGFKDEEFECKESSLEGLTDMFPFKSPEKLKEMLIAAKGDVNKVIDWLSN